jgi:lipopolysaccharide/colanic/teichoic acid biosynthesis glycosyltransferase
MVMTTFLPDTGPAAVSRPAPDRRRRLMDFGFACALLALCAPVLALVSLAILIESGRPVFFSQVRLGQGGATFRMFKFRKFYKHIGAGLPLTQVGDSRMTRVGRILCATKLDELPQLWNVLRGDMAVVGPRPESLDFADAFKDVARLLDHKPGLLGPSQAVFRDESALFADEPNPTAVYRKILLPAKARIDIAYYESRTLWTDLSWIVFSVVATLRLDISSAQRRRAIQNEPEVMRRMEVAGIIKRSEASYAAVETSSVP